MEFLFWSVCVTIPPSEDSDAQIGPLLRGSWSPFQAWTCGFMGSEPILMHQALFIFCLKARDVCNYPKCEHMLPILVGRKPWLLMRFIPPSLK